MRESMEWMSGLTFVGIDSLAVVCREDLEALDVEHFELAVTIEPLVGARHQRAELFVNRVAKGCAFLQKFGEKVAVG